MYLFSTMISELSFGLITSIEIFLLTILFSMPLGLAVALGRMSRIRPIQWIMKAYISIMRGTPLMLQLIVVFFGPYYIFGMTLSREFRMIAVIIAFTINYAAYFAEIFRGGIESIPNGQYEAAQVLGYNRLETFFIIILPQVIKIVLPSITNEVITLVKDTSLSFVLAIPEMFTVAKQIAAAQKQGEQLGLTADELAFYDALTKPQAIKDFYKNEELIAITKELTEALRRNKTIDWQKRESARAKMRMLIKKLLKKHDYPPEGREDAVQTVMTQCELWADNNDMASEENIVDFREAGFKEIPMENDSFYEMFGEKWKCIEMEAEG